MFGFNSLNRISALNQYQQKVWLKITFVERLARCYPKDSVLFFPAFKLDDILTRWWIDHNVARINEEKKEKKKIHLLENPTVQYATLLIGGKNEENEKKRKKKLNGDSHLSHVSRISKFA